ncbi:MAG: dTMP kinase [Sulfurovaceae bacterium]|nr:dTMP kinase [Sulfurovaceae bacterium]
MYILFEGIDTCGKTTQISLLKQKFPDFLITHEPGGTLFGKQVRQILLDCSLGSKRAEILLFLADRAEHYETVVKPNNDKTIISDRGFVSGMAYAMANTDIDFDTLFKLNLFALEGALPEFIVLFITNEDTLTQRLDRKGLDGIEQRGISYLLDVQSHMKKIISKLDIPCLEIDATQDIETIQTKITNYLRTAL